MLLIGFGAVAALLLLELGLRIQQQLAPNATPAAQLARAGQLIPPPHGQGPCQPAETHPLAALVRPSDNQAIVYELKSDLDACCWGGPQLGYHVQTNHEGIRATREYSHRKPPGVFRIVGLGDSLMFGLGVGNEDLYSVKIERQLSAALGRPVEFINLAVPGYNTAIEAEVLRTRGLHYAPDLIILHWCSNDCGVPFFLQQSPTRTSWQQSLLFELMMTTWRARRPPVLQTQEELVSVPIETINAPQPDGPPPYRWMIGREGVTRALDTIRRLTASPRQIPVVVVLMGFHASCMPSDALRQAFVNRSFHALLIEHPMAHWLSPTDNHLNVRGHDNYARQIVAGLAGIGLLPPRAPSATTASQ